MNVTILSPRRVIHAGQARRVFLPGDLAEFEILDYHAPIVSLLRAGDVVVDGLTRVPIHRGMVKFDRDECMILVEEQSSLRARKPVAEESARTGSSERS